MTQREIGVEEARKVLGNLVDDAALDGTTTYLTRRGRRFAAIVPLSLVKESTVFTVEIQAGSDESGWQALAPKENAVGDLLDTKATAEDVARWTATNQDVADGAGWRVCVWDGSDADTGLPPAAVVYARDTEAPVDPAEQ